MLRQIALCLLLLIPPLASGPAVAQEDKLTKAQLDQLLAPIALYPDDLLASVLVAATYPLEVVQAARWRAEPENAKLEGEALAKALDAKDWDPSVKSLTQVPDLLKKMSDELEWTERLGNAFLAQQAEVMDEIQYLRRKAEEAGSLASNRQQRVSEQGDDIIIEPAQTSVVYVPVYDPSEVYGPWWYEDYPPYDWTWSGAPLASGYYWGTGAVIASAVWAWGDLDWRRRDIDIDVDKWNRIDVNRPKISSTRWEHNPAHRGAVPYKGDSVRSRFESGGAEQGQIKDRPRGPDQPKIESKLKEGAAKDRKPGDARDRSTRATPDRKETGQRKAAPRKSTSAAAGKARAGSKGPAKKSAAKPKSGGSRASGIQRPAVKSRPPGGNVRSARGTPGRAMAGPGRSGGGGRRGGGRR